MKNITVKRIVPRGSDFYPTPAWATEALLEHESFEGEVWEPACGDGAMTEVLRKSGLKVQSSDLYDRGFGATGIDFLKARTRVDNIVTNPPFSLAEAFILNALSLARRKTAIFSRLAILESARRYETVFKNSPPTRILVFSERVTLYPSGIITAGTSTIAYCWLIWDKADESGKSTLSWIAPGRKPSNKAKREKPPLGITLKELFR